MMKFKEIQRNEGIVFSIGIILLLVLSLLRALVNDGLTSGQEMKVFVILVIASIHVASVSTSIVLLIFKKWGHVSFLLAVLLFGLYSFSLNPSSLASSNNGQDMPAMHGH